MNRKRVDKVGVSPKIDQSLDPKDQVFVITAKSQVTENLSVDFYNLKGKRNKRIKEQSLIQHQLQFLQEVIAVYQMMQYSQLPAVLVMLTLG